ncbi:hypothetical protein DV738_g1777, partial [Chaetothyriales sp. CBS 135597]
MSFTAGVRCEVATYVWIQDKCPDVPLPRLQGFAFSSGQTFTALDNVALHRRAIVHIQRWLCSLLRRPVPCRYSRYQAIPPLTTGGYLLLDYIDRTDAVMLSESWESHHRHDPVRRTALFTGLSRILLSLSQTPLPRLASFTIDDQGVVDLSNRPLTLRLHQMESEGIPSAISPRNKTYTSTEPYLLDLLAGQDQRLQHQLNAINSESDCKAQMAALTGVRATLHHFLDRDQSQGPFYLTLTDIHQSNIFVDKDWNVKYLIDLDIDSLLQESLSDFNLVREEFMNTWDSGRFWVYHALDNHWALPALFWQHIQPMFALSHVGDEHFDRIFAPYWCRNIDTFIQTKLTDRAEYDNQLKQLYETH